MATEVMASRLRTDGEKSVSSTDAYVHAGAELCCFRVDADSRIGWGHLRRCLAIADALPSRLSPVFCFSDGSADAAARLGNAGRQTLCGTDPVAGLAEQTGAAPALVVADLAHPPWLDAPESLRREIAAWRQAGSRVALIDGLAPLALVEGGDWPLDLYIAPYCGAAPPPGLPPGRSLCGPAYAIIPALPARAASDAGPLHLLVTLGGADPCGTTLRVLEALASLDGRTLTTRVVLGPAFGPALRRKIRSLAAADITLVDSPDGLGPHYAWADLAVAGTGLTKYELAAAGLPSVLISLNDASAEAHRAFEAEATAVHLGTDATVDSAMIARAIAALADDPARRADLSRRGRALVDGQGAARTAAALEALIDD